MKVVQVPRGTTEQEDAITGYAGQIRADMSRGELRLHDGERQGGQRILNEDGVRALIASGLEQTGTGSIQFFSSNDLLAAATPNPTMLAIVSADGFEEAYIWDPNTDTEGTGIVSDVDGHWKRVNNKVGLYIRLKQADLIEMQINGVEPAASQDTTAWLDNGTVKLWDGADYLAATPELFARLLAKIGNYYVGAFSLPDRLAATLTEISDCDAVTDSGWYKTAAAATNAAISGVHVFEHRRISSTLEMQTLWSQGSTSLTRYVRWKNTTWGSWISSDSVLPSRLAATSGFVTDADTATESGFYNANSTATNIPAVEKGTLTVVRYSATAITQIWASTDSTKVYKRAMLASAWGAWSAVGGQLNITTHYWTATAGQTSFTGASATPAITTGPSGDGYALVNREGSWLGDNDYAFSGVDLTLNFSDIELGERVEVRIVVASPIPTTVSAGAIGSTELANNAVTNAKLADMVQATLKGRASGAGTGDPTDLTAAQVAAILASVISPERFPTLSNNTTDATNDLDFTTGSIWDSGYASRATLSALTKQLDANWAAGNSQGMRYSGAAIANTTYHIWAVWKADGADPDYYATPNGSAATEAAALTLLQAESGGANYIYAQRVWSIVRDSGVIRPFTQMGNHCLWKTPLNVYNANPGATTAFTITGKTPAGIKVLGQYSGYLSIGASGSSAYFSSLDQTDVAADGVSNAQMVADGVANIIVGGGNILVRTNTSSQIRGRVSTAVTTRLNEHGYFDERGRA